MAINYRERPRCRKVLNKLADEGCFFFKPHGSSWYVEYPDGRCARLSEGLNRQLNKMQQEGAKQ